MEYLQLNSYEKENHLAALATMPDYLESIFAALTDAELVRNGPAGEFSPLEQVWHLADLEQEGFAARIQLLLQESGNEMPDFDGDKVAAERQYKTLALTDGIEKFRAARNNNIQVFKSLAELQWQKAGTLEGVGKVMLCDMPAFLLQHDLAHKAEITAWKNSVTSGKA